jgi:peptide/nickel transport system substrate-binding protein
MLSQIQTADLYDTPFNLRPVGSGPFRLEELTQERAVLVANTSYHLGPAFVQRIELRFYRDDGALFAALRSGALQGRLLRQRDRAGLAGLGGGAAGAEA